MTVCRDVVQHVEKGDFVHVDWILPNVRYPIIAIAHQLASNAILQFGVPPILLMQRLIQDTCDKIRDRRI